VGSAPGQDDDVEVGAVQLLDAVDGEGRRQVVPRAFRLVLAQVVV
jgi:hypothetical protein